MRRYKYILIKIKWYRLCRKRKRENKVPRDILSSIENTSTAERPPYTRARHICAVRTIDSFDTRESQRALNVREWKIARESRLLPLPGEKESLSGARARARAHYTSKRPQQSGSSFTVHYLFSHRSARHAESSSSRVPFPCAEMRNFDTRAR